MVSRTLNTSGAGREYAGTLVVTDATAPVTLMSGEPPIVGKYGSYGKKIGRFPCTVGSAGLTDRLVRSITPKNLCRRVTSTSLPSFTGRTLASSTTKNPVVIHTANTLLRVVVLPNIFWIISCTIIGCD